MLPHYTSTSTSYSLPGSVMSPNDSSILNERPTNPTPIAAAMEMPPARCPSCHLLWNNIHRQPKIMPGCLHTVCKYCITQVSLPKKKFRCAVESCEIIINLGKPWSKEVFEKQLNSLPINIPAIVSSLIGRILKGNPRCDDPFCCKRISNCSNTAIYLSRNNHYLICEECCHLMIPLDDFWHNNIQP